MANIDIGLSGNQHINRTEKIRQLLEENREALILADPMSDIHTNGICYDGIINQRKYKRIVFLLKETNGNDSNGEAGKLNDWDYRLWLERCQSEGLPTGNKGDSTQFYGRTFKKLSMWADVLVTLMDKKSVLPFEEYEKEKLDQAYLRETLKKIAIINLKKTWGGGTADLRRLDTYLKSEAVRSVLKEQMYLAVPEIVVCGGRQVYDYAKAIFGGDEKCFDLPSGDKLEFFRDHDTVYVNFYHPAYRKSTLCAYNMAVERFGELMKHI